MQNNFSFERFANYQDIANTTQYVVKQGDTLFSIAKKYDVPVNEIVNLNKLSSTMIYPNQILFIPKKNNNSVGYKEYITKTGDTVKKIIDKTGISYNELEGLNDLNNLELAPNQIIKINEKLGNNLVTVKDDSDLNKILNNNSITPLELIELNRQSWLKPGSKIIVG